MTQILRYFSAAAVLALPLTGAAFAQSVELRYATSAPPKTVWEMQVVRFQKQIEDGSKGSLADRIRALQARSSRLSTSAT